MGTPLNQKGLTLIEVMVATTILSLVLIGVLTTASHVARSSQRLHQKTLAHWVGQNAATQLRLGILGQMSTTGGYQGQVFMGSEYFDWQAKNLDQVDMIAVRMDVTASEKGAVLATVYTYLPEITP